MKKGKRSTRWEVEKKLTVNDFKTSEQRLKVVRRFKMIERMKNGQK